MQRQHRTKLLQQIPFLSLPALPVAKDDARSGSDDDSDDDKVVVSRKKGAGKEKKAKGGKGGGGKKGRGAAAAEEPAPEETADVNAEQQSNDDVLTVMDTIWPKKEGLTLVKWCDLRSIAASLSLQADSLLSDAVEIMSPSSPFMASHCSSNISKGRISRH